MIDDKKPKSFLDIEVVKTINNYLFDYFSFIVIYVVLVVIVFGYFFLLKPKYDEIKVKNEAELNKKKSELKDLQIGIDSYEGYINIYENINKESKDKVANFLPDKNDSEELLVYFRDMVKRSELGGLQLTALSIEDLVTKKKEGGSGASGVKRIPTTGTVSTPATGVDGGLGGSVGEIKISLSVDGIDYGGLNKFLQILERDARFFDIENVDFSLSEHSASLDLKAYYLK